MFQAHSDLFSNAKVKGLCLIHLLQFSITLVRVFISGSARRKIAKHINSRYCRVLGSGTYSLVGDWTRILIYCLSDSLFQFAVFFDTMNNTFSDHSDFHFSAMYIVVSI